MKTILKKLAFGFVFMILGISCNVIDSNTNKVISYPLDVVVTDLVLPTGESWQNMQHDSIYRIDSQHELILHLSSSIDIPEINFEQYSLIVVIGTNNSGIESVSSQMKQTAEDKYTLSVNIESNDATVVEGWKVAILLPKLAENTVIELSIKKDVNDPNTVGYIVGYEGCGLVFKGEYGEAKGYVVISEDLKDTLMAYNMPQDIYNFPKEIFPATQPGTVNWAFTEQFRHTFKIQFGYTLSSAEEVRELGLRDDCVIPGIYLIRSMYKNCTPVIINSAVKID